MHSKKLPLPRLYLKVEDLRRHRLHAQSVAVALPPKIGGVFALKPPNDLRLLVA